MVDYPKDWKLESIGEIFNTITDYVAAGSFKDLSENVRYYNSPNYAQLIRTRDIKSKFKNRDFIFINKQAYDYLWRVHFDDTKIIMPNIGNCGEVYFVEIDKLPHERCVLGPNAIMLFDTDDDMKFIYYALQRNDFQKDLKDIISPSGQTKFNKTDLSKINIRIPADIREQKAIAETLMTFDRHIENLERLIEKKKMVRDGVVEELVSGKRRLAGFSGEWETVHLYDLLIPYGGLSGKNSRDFLGGNTKYISYLNVFNNTLITSVNNKVVIHPGERQNVVSNGDILFTQSSETVEEVGMASTYIGKEDVYLNSFCFGSKKKRELDSIFMVSFLRSKELREQISKEGQGSTRYNLSPNRLMNICVTIPPSLPEQQAIADILMAMDKEIADLEEEKEKYVALKAGAMDDLLTGKIRLV